MAVKSKQSSNVTNRKATAKNKGGAPTKYRLSYCQAIISYFEDCEVLAKIVDDPSGRGGSNTHYEAIRVPSIEGFAASIHVSKDTIYEWANTKYPEKHKLKGKLRHPEFSDALSRAQTIQEGLIFEYGMTNRLSNSIATLYLTNKMGYRNASHLDMTSDGERLQTAPVVVSAIAARQPDNAPAQPEAS